MGKKVLQSDGTYCYTENCHIHNRFSLSSLSEQLDSIDKNNGTVFLAGKPVPVVSFQELYHVGTLDPLNKKAESYEGRGFSVSVNPDEWRKIAHLSGGVSKLTKSGNRFIDYYNLTKQQLRSVAQWGLEKGYIKEVTSYVVSWWDDEWESNMSISFDSLEEASEEAENYETVPVSVQSYAADSSFPDSTVKEGALGVEHILFTVWASENTSYDGVWWDETLDVSRLSAPRGVILNRELKGWDITSV